jgi:hypothetical protein
MGLNDHIDDGKGPSPPVYIDGIIAMLKKEGWIEDKTFIPWTGSGGVTRCHMPLHKSR